MSQETGRAHIAHTARVEREVRMRHPGSVVLISSFYLILIGAAVCPVVAEDDAAQVDERVVVTATRLDDHTVPKSDVPASVTIIDRERIEASGTRNLQDLLADEAGVVLIDQVGNDVQKTIDLRGFAGGKGIAVFVDGARVNDPRNNTVALEQYALDAIERVEITRGPAAALAGGGAEAGVIRVTTRRGTTPAASITASAGSWKTSRFDGSFGGSFGDLDVFVSGAYDTTDGFRPNAGGDQTRLDGTLGYDFGSHRRLSFSVLSSRLDYGNPGALTLAEFETNPGGNVYNTLDYSDVDGSQVALDFQGPLGGGFSLAANLAYRSDDARTLTTGRNAALFGGFFLDASGGTWSGAAQATRDIPSSRGSHRVVFGVEGLDGHTDSEGFFTSSTSPGAYDPSAPASRNTAGAMNSGLFVQDTWSVSTRWTVNMGARGDHSRVRYVDSLSGAMSSDHRTYQELSFRAGTTFRATERLDLYASYGDAFLPPTPEQLFAYPGFGSNPALAPEDARAYELGTRTSGRLGTLEAAVFWTDTKNEIVFDPAPTPGNQFGQNVNAGAARRRGVELSARGRIARGTAVFANASYTDATFSNGANSGNEVPLVPRVRTAAGVDARLPKEFRIGADAVYVGAQVLDNDPNNSRAKLDAYTVVNLRLAWERALDRFASSRSGRLALFLEARNLLDARYATRGITAQDFSTFPPVDVDYVTPAPGRRYLAGVTWRM